MLIVPDLEPLFLKHGVDVYLAGHWHYYESLWPVKSPPPGGRVPAGCQSYQNATAGYPTVTTAGCTTQTSFDNPGLPSTSRQAMAGHPVWTVLSRTAAAEGI